MRGATYIGFVVNDRVALDDRQPLALTRFVEVNVLPVRPHRIEDLVLHRELHVEEEERVRPWSESEGLARSVDHLIVVARVASERYHRALSVRNAGELCR